VGRRAKKKNRKGKKTTGLVKKVAQGSTSEMGEICGILLQGQLATWGEPTHGVVPSNLETPPGEDQETTLSSYNQPPKRSFIQRGNKVKRKKATSQSGSLNLTNRGKRETKKRENPESSDEEEKKTIEKFFWGASTWQKKKKKKATGGKKTVKLSRDDFETLHHRQVRDTRETTRKRVISTRGYNVWA